MYFCPGLSERLYKGIGTVEYDIEPYAYHNNGESSKRSVQRLGSWMGEGEGKEPLNCYE